MTTQTINTTDFNKCGKCIHRFTCTIMPSTCKGAETRPVDRSK